MESWAVQTRVHRVRFLLQAGRLHFCQVPCRLFGAHFRGHFGALRINQSREAVQDCPTIDHHATYRCAHCTVSPASIVSMMRQIKASIYFPEQQPHMHLYVCCHIMQPAGVHNPGAAPSAPSLHSLGLASFWRFRLHSLLYSFYSNLQWSFPITTSR